MSPCQLLQHNPRLLSGPWQTFSIVNILAKCILPQFADTGSNDVFHRFLDTLTIADFME
jgi:hypothetical protein